MTYTSYIKKEFLLTPGLFYDVFTNLCEPEMKKKLDTVKDVKQLGEDGIWEAIENFWVENNPMFMRRLKVIDLKLEKGEEAGDFFNRLKNQFDEAEMEKASIWTLFICKLINSIPETGNDAIALKNKLLEEFRETQNPSKSELVKFKPIITMYESLITAREYKGEVDTRVNRVTHNETPLEPRKGHYLCNTIHPPGKYT